MDTEEDYLVDKRYVKDDPSKKTDFGWRFHGKTVLLHEDKSIVYDISTSQMEEALRKMSTQFSFLDTCLQCGLCTDWCPNSHLVSQRKFSPRELIQRLRLGLLDLSGEELWACTNCGGCTTKCLYDIPLIDVIISLRALVVEQGAGYIPVTVKKALSSVRAFMNPWMEEQGKRAEWLAETGIQPSPSDGAILLFAGCYPSYDLRARKIAQAAARLMDSLGIDFDILGEKEVCCGDSAMRVGDFDTFNRLKAINISNIESRGLSKVYTLSPHCAQVMKTGYFKTMRNSSR